jgi:hypothetical protein
MLPRPSHSPVAIHLRILPWLLAAAAGTFGFAQEESQPRFRTEFAPSPLWHALGDEAAMHPVSPESIRSMAWSVPLQRLYVGYGGGVLWEWDARSRRRVARLPDLEVWTISPDGRFLAGAPPGSASQQTPMIRIWDLSTGAVLQQFAAAGSVARIVFTPATDRLIILTSGGAKDNWSDTLTSLPLRSAGLTSIPIPKSSKTPGHIFSSLTGVIVYQGEEVLVFDPKTLRKVEDHGFQTRLADGAWLRMKESSRGGYLVGWNFEGGAVFDLKSFQTGMADPVVEAFSEAGFTSTLLTSMDVSPDEARVAVARHGGFTLYELPGGAEIGSREVPTEALAFSPNGRLLTVANAAGIQHIDAATGAPVTSGEAAVPSWPWNLEFALGPSGRQLVLNHGTWADIWDLEERRLTRRVRAGNHAIGSVSFLPDGTGLLFAHGTQVRQLALQGPEVLEAGDGQVIWESGGLSPKAFLTTTLASDGKTMAVAAGDQLWVGRTGENDWRKLYVRTDSLTGMRWLRFTPDGQQLIYRHEGTGVVRHDLATDAVLFDQRFTQGALLPDGTRFLDLRPDSINLVSTLPDGPETVRISLPKLGEKSMTFTKALTFGPRGELLAAVHPLAEPSQASLLILSLEDPKELRLLPIERGPVGLAMSGDDRVVMVHETLCFTASLETLRSAARVVPLPAPQRPGPVFRPRPTAPEASAVPGPSPAVAPGQVAAAELVTWDPVEIPGWLSFDDLHRRHDDSANGAILASLVEAERVWFAYQQGNDSAGFAGFDLRDPFLPARIPCDPLPERCARVLAQPKRSVTVRMGAFPATLHQLNDHGALASTPTGPELTCSGGIARLDPATGKWSFIELNAFESLRGARRIGERYYAYAGEQDGLQSGCGIVEFDAESGESRRVLTNQPSTAPRNVWESEPQFWIQGVMPSRSGRLAVAIGQTGLLHEFDLRTGECWPVLNFPESGMPPFLPDVMRWTETWALTSDTHEPGNLTAVAVNRLTGEWELLFQGRQRFQIRPGATNRFQGSAGRQITAAQGAKYVFPAPVASNLNGGETGMWYDGSQLFALAPESGPDGEAILYWWNEQTPRDRPVRIPMRCTAFQRFGLDYDPPVRARDRDRELNRSLRRVDLTSAALVFESNKVIAYLPRPAFDAYVQAQAAKHGWKK